MLSMVLKLPIIGMPINHIQVTEPTLVRRLSLKKTAERVPSDHNNFNEEEIDALIEYLCTH